MGFIIQKIKKFLASVFKFKRKAWRSFSEILPGAPKLSSALQRAEKNPILTPNSDQLWESSAVFNTAALHLANKTHFLYRAIGHSGVSVLGYATSKDGIHIDERSDNPAYICKGLSRENLLAPFSHPYMSGGSWSGCEDPRLTQLDDRVFMTYTIFDGVNPPGIALTSISVEDFLNQRWNWQKPKLISPPQEMHKNWVIFPEKIQGRYAILHSITPRVLVDYFDTLDFDTHHYVQSCYYSAGRENFWDNWIRGVGAPPLKTSDGWLVFYHAMDKNDPNKYKLGALILDKDDPTKILYRANRPILQPDAHYENHGFKSGVIYTCGAVIIGKKIFVYYGGADTVICAASANLKDLLSQIKESG